MWLLILEIWRLISLIRLIKIVVIQSVDLVQWMQLIVFLVKFQVIIRYFRMELVWQAVQQGILKPWLVTVSLAFKNVWIVKTQHRLALNVLRVMFWLMESVMKGLVVQGILSLIKLINVFMKMELNALLLALNVEHQMSFVLDVLLDT